MLSILLIVIYLAFISLGLPDSLLGSAWPVMGPALGMPLSAVGLISMIITGGTIVSSLLSSRLLRRFGTGRVTFVSVLLTAAALFGFSLSPSFLWLCLLGIPLGLGAGAVDSALNNFVALHYRARHMSWLHCFWGLGATAGPLILSAFLTTAHGWQMGYRIIALLQSALVLLLLFSLPLWRRAEAGGPSNQTGQALIVETAPKVRLFSLPTVRAALLSFFCYCALETTTGLWGSSYLVRSRDVPADQAAQWVSLFYMGITAGRLLAGFAAGKLNGRTLVRLGQGLILLGLSAFLLPLPTVFCAPGFALVGMGCAPIFPSIIHSTPARVGSTHSQSLMGIQMAFAYIGSTLMPPLFGAIATAASPALLPVYLLVLLAVMVFSVEQMNRAVP